MLAVLAGALSYGTSAILARVKLNAREINQGRKKKNGGLSRADADDAGR
jgi:hypothetical protein